MIETAFSISALERGSNGCGAGVVPVTCWATDLSLSRAIVLCDEALGERFSAYRSSCVLASLHDVRDAQIWGRSVNNIRKNRDFVYQSGQEIDKWA